MHLPCVSAMLFESVMLLLAVLVSGLRTAGPTPCATGTEETTPNKIQNTSFRSSLQTFKLSISFINNSIPVDESVHDNQILAYATLNQYNKIINKQNDLLSCYINALASSGLMLMLSLMNIC
jgi:hypothetical protein